MNWGEIGELAHEGENGLVRKTVYCNKKSVRQSEYYQAASQGYQPELMLEIRTEEYEGEELFLMNDKQYRIMRTFDKPNGITELTLAGMYVDHDFLEVL